MTVTLLTDFSDRLSPMVVKELRQGLRTRLFGGVMLVLHALLVLITLMGGTSANSGEVHGMVDGLLAMTLYLVFPLSGFSALSGEIKGNTMDMLVLTRLSAGRIVLGKWASIVFQSLLVTVSVMPYIVARYVYGGSDLLADVLGLGFQWLVSAVLTAGIVALSTQKQFWLRSLLITLPLFIMALSSVSWVFMNTFKRAALAGGSSSLGFYAYLGWLVGCVWLIFALLSFGASRIAPAASLLPVWKRSVNFIALFVLVGLAWLGSGSASVITVVLLVQVVACLDAMTDDVRNLPSIYLPFYRRSWWGRLGALFLAPGWMHGFLFSLLLTGASALLVFQVSGPYYVSHVWLMGCGLWVSSFFGQLLAFRRKGEYLSATFAGMCLLGFLTMMNFLLQASTRKEELKWLRTLLPLNTWSMMDEPKTGLWNPFEIGLVVNAVWPLLLALLAMRAFRQTRSARREARQLA